MGATIMLAAATLFLPVSSAQAEPAPRASFDACIDASEGITSNILDCIGTEYDYQDARLNAVYKRVMAGLTSPQRTVLRDSQRRWLREREPKCWEEVGEEAGGTLGTIIRNNCMLFALVERIDWLEAYRPRQA